MWPAIVKSIKSAESPLAFCAAIRAEISGYHRLTDERLLNTASGPLFLSSQERYDLTRSFFLNGGNFAAVRFDLGDAKLIEALGREMHKRELTTDTFYFRCSPCSIVCPCSLK